MNKLYISIITSLMMVFMLASCSPDEYSLNAPDVKSSDLVEGKAFSIEHDKNNPNIVYLKSLMGSRYTPVWTHPQGRSTKQEVTLKIAFPGTYDVVFGVETQGGVVYSDTVTFTISDTYTDFVTDELWTYLTGGIGKSKVWIHDNGDYGLASGEVDYADPSTVVEWNNFTTNWDPGVGHTGDDKIFGSTMTFTLDNGAFVQTHNVSKDGEFNQSGTFFLNTDNHTISFTGADIIHTKGWDFKTTNWKTNLRVLTLTKDQLRVAVLRETVSGESEWWMVWNYVSKEYADKYVPENIPDPVPSIDGTANDVISTTKTKTWVLADNAPYDWSDLNGVLINNFTDKQSYLSTGWAAYSEQMIDATKFKFTATSGTKGKFVFSSYGNSDVEGTYIVDADNDVEFNQPLSAIISKNMEGWTSTIKLETSAENRLRILKTKTDVFGTVTDMWLGQRSLEKKEYMVYHFKVASAAADAPSIVVGVDNSKLVFGDLEEKGDFRVEIYNEYGKTKDNPPVDKSKFAFANSMSVTFTLKGISLKSGAKGSYPTAISFASGDWGVQYWGGGSGDTTVKGNGTYTVSFLPTSTSAGIAVFTLDMKGLVSDIVDMSKVSVTVDKIELK